MRCGRWEVRRRRELGLVGKLALVAGGVLMARKFGPEIRRYLRMSRM